MKQFQSNDVCDSTISWNLVPAADIPLGAMDNCDRVAFQHTNLVQSHVVFLNIDPVSLRILNASTNTEAILGISFEKVLNSTLDDQLVQGASRLKTKLLHSATTTRNTIVDTSLINHRGEPLMVRVSRLKTRWLFEIELLSTPFDLKPGEIADLPVVISDLLEDVKKLEELGPIVDAIRQSLYLDHCLLYRFDMEYNGEVIAESYSSRVSHRFLGLRFPTRDVPLSARRMMQCTHVRTAMDQQIDCVPIQPRFDPISGEDIDLTLVRGRGSVQTCQSFYVNLGVRAKLILPLSVQGSLWGMISCHHQDPLRISPSLDPYLITIARLTSHAIERMSRELVKQAEERGRKAIRVLAKRSPSFDNALAYLQDNIDDFKSLIPCGGLILRIAGNTMTSGNVPNKDDLAPLLDTLWEASQGKRLTSNCLPTRLPNLEALRAVACGALAIPLGTHRQDIAVWIRPEQVQDVQWAGCPNENVHADIAQAPYLSPRTSFEVWRNQAKGTSISWTDEEISLADSATMQLALVVLGWYATQASIAKNEFFACISHELRTPLTAILGFADLLSEELNPDFAQCPVDEYVETIRRNGAHLLKVIDDVLDMAKIESGKLKVERISVDLETLVGDIVTLMRARADEKRLGLKVIYQSDVPKFISTDPVRLRQILLNLLGNAIKFTEVGSVTLSISMDLSVGERMVFEVIDTGIGMTAVQLTKLFQAFSQADASTTRRFGGSGLGLMISKNLAQLLGGDISVSSVPGTGSTFRVCIATGNIAHSQNVLLKSVTGTAIIERNQSSKTNLRQFQNIADKSILLIEDGVDNQRLIAFLLGKAGATVSIMSNGKRGLESLTLDGTIHGALRLPINYDLILTDMQMPELDGYTTTRMLRQKGCDVPIIALTAFAMNSDAKKCLEAGCDDYLSKPIAKDELLGKVSTWLMHSSRRGKTASANQPSSFAFFVLLARFPNDDLVESKLAILMTRIVNFAIMNIASNSCFPFRCGTVE